VHGEVEPARAASCTRGEHAVDRIDRAVLGAAEHGDRHQYRLALARASVELLLQRVEIEAHAARRQQVKLRTAEAEQLHALAPRVVRRDRREYARHAQRGMFREEPGKAKPLDARGIDAFAPARTLGHRLRGKPALPRLQQRDDRVAGKVERVPVVFGHVEVRHARRAQRERKRLHRQREAQRLVVRRGAARGEVAERAVRPRRVVHVAEHARELQADLDFHVDRDRSGILADIVRVVGQGEHVRGEARQQQVRRHVADVARTVERYRALQRRRKLVQLAARARLEREVVRMPGRLGADRRRVLRMEVATPVDMVAQELDQQLFEQRVVLAVRSEETRVQRVVMCGCGAIAHGDHDRRSQELPRACAAAARGALTGVKRAAGEKARRQRGRAALPPCTGISRVVLPPRRCAPPPCAARSTGAARTRRTAVRQPRRSCRRACASRSAGARSPGP